MHVVATAGHVDHGKSTLVRALTGMEPDRWAEERRRGMTIDLGFAWTDLASGERIALVDVPGHERFITNMLAGVGAAPAVAFVVAADEGWKPQSQEHLDVLAAMGVRDGVLIITKADLADPQPALDKAMARLGERGLEGMQGVAVDGVTGAGLSELREALDKLVARLPRPDTAAPVRLWVDRAFTIRGAGTVVTGTLSAGTISTGDELVLAPAMRTVVVRRMESCKETCERVSGTARVAVNLRGVDRHDVSRGMCLVTPGDWTHATQIDVLVQGAEPLGDQVVTHLGSSAVPTRVRRLGPGAARLRLASPVPLHVGDRLLLRAPETRKVHAAVVADLRPADISRRGAASRVAEALFVPSAADEEVRRRGMVTVPALRATGLRDRPTSALMRSGWWVDPPLWDRWRQELAATISGPAAASGMSSEHVRDTLAIPTAELMAQLVDETPGVAAAGGLLYHDATEPPPLSAALRALCDRLLVDPLAAPTAEELSAGAIAGADLAHAVRRGLLVRLADGVFVGPRVVDHALERLRELTPPFTVSEAKQALGSSRRVVVPLLEHLDSMRLTRRIDDDHREVVERTA